MSYTVETTAGALDEIEAAYQWLAERTPQHAPEWYNAALEAMVSLETNPTRCPIDDPQKGTRKVLFGDKRNAYRMIFSIRGSTVYILHIRHSARQE